MALAIAASGIGWNEYLEGELVSDIKHEYINGRVIAMSGGTWNHQQVALNFTSAARQQLKGKSCSPMTSDFKIRVDPGRGAEAFYHSDGAIVCTPVAGNAQFTDTPTVILEVLSPATRRNDEIQKYRDYINIPTLQTYIIAEPDTLQLILYRRDGDGFQREILTGRDSILELPEVEVSIPLAEIHPDVRGS